ncbi:MULTISPECIES: heme lyase CcmF/NrfE family subunit [unclassified Pseudovibrio]|uniref:heme lyase CcmF/NrfE family subunit n=1 Tax=unclassified Pseudovibrio TaxID=2627060 RepID=UPI0007AEAF81|nr:MULTISPECIES: heme lyase CcmF/NrfE family subunit [unclassified Pseudovibrio]KZL18516.1 Cytochrome c-type biogenesis protein CcmF [Pseudovibrio sp. WM33]KZL25017.1 Cytochrome c-type biogenesis protein CcmF [Pseudovibrio sp. Ad37]
MIIELGHYALILALVVAAVQSVFPVWGAVNSDHRLMGMAPGLAVLMFLLTCVAFAALTWAYLNSDFSLLNTYQNSHSDKPLVYKISGVWGNHEGSILLWVLILVLFGALVAVFSRNIPQRLRAATLGAQGWVSFAFLLFVIVASNPFTRISPAPLQGSGLNPMLQDVGLAIHPPILYIGYVGFSIVFAFAAAALILGKLDAAWARWVRPWILVSWIFLTLGIAMGSYWAYYELGWGGWWFWDPVENASFMPWLTGTALLHSAIVMERRDALKVWTVFLALLTFSLSLLGTFLVRSGVLTSVHAFAVDPARGLFILAILLIFVGGSLTLFAWRAPLLRQGGLFAPISREGSLVLNNLFLTTACAAVFVGTLYPLVLEAFSGDKISVGAPFFNLTFGPIMVPVLILMPFGQLLAWKRGDAWGVAQRLTSAFVIAMLATVGLIWFMGVSTTSIMTALGFGLAFWAIFGSLWEIIERSQLFKIGFGRSMARIKGFAPTVWSTVLGHAGLGITVLGIVTTMAFESERVEVMRPGDTLEQNGYNVTYEKSWTQNGPNYQEMVSQYTLRKGGNVVGIMEPSKRAYNASGMPMSETSIATFGFSQVYFATGDSDENGGIVTRIYFKPLITLIWIGTLLMSLGGCIALFDRRLRVGAPVSARKRKGVAGSVATATPTPAE